MLNNRRFLIYFRHNRYAIKTIDYLLSKQIKKFKNKSCELFTRFVFFVE